MHPARSAVGPEATNLRPLTLELTLRQYLKMKEAQRRLSAELGREVDLGEMIGILSKRFLAAHAEANALGGERSGGSMSRVVPHGLLGGAPNVRQASGASFSSA